MLMHNSQYSLLPELSYYIWHYSEILPGILEPTSISMRLEEHAAKFLTIHKHADYLDLLCACYWKHWAPCISLDISQQTGFSRRSDHKDLKRNSLGSFYLPEIP